MVLMALKNPFRPGGPVEPEYFIGRKDEIKLFERFLKSTKDGNPFNIAVLGEIFFQPSFSMIYIT